MVKQKDDDYYHADDDENVNFFLFPMNDCWFSRRMIKRMISQE